MRKNPFCACKNEYFDYRFRGNAPFDEGNSSSKPIVETLKIEGDKNGSLPRFCHLPNKEIKDIVNVFLSIFWVFDASPEFLPLSKLGDD